MKKESVWSLKENAGEPGSFRSSDLILTFTRKGIEVNGYYDSIVGIGPTTLITWEEIDRRRKEVSRPLKAGDNDAQR